MNVRLQQTTFDFLPDETVYRVLITDKPELKERSILCKAQVLEQKNPASAETLNAQAAVLLYFSLDSAGKTIRRGDELLLSARLSLPVNRGNPDEFDYPRYLMYKGVSGTGFVPSGKWKTIAHHTGGSITNYALDCRDKVLELYSELNFQGDNFAILSALTVGYKDELSESIRESFSVSGASHILALSGLHIGLLCMFLFFLLNRLPGSSMRMQIVRVGVVIVLLWGFAFLTGLSPSVVRSVVMFSLLGISQFSTARPMSLNTLYVAGIGMLIYNPAWLFDVGFQLSFVAVASILLIQPWLYKQLTVRNSFQDRLWGLITVSIAAQIGTAPLVLLYFSRFPVHFLLTNIVVIPLVTIIIYVAVIMLLLSFLPVINQLIAYGLNILLDILGGTVRWIEKMPFASIDHVWLYQFEVLLFYFGVLFVGWYVVCRRPRFLLACLAVVFTLSIYRVYMVEIDRPQQSLVFYNVRNCPAVHCILPDGRSWIAYTDSVHDDQRLARSASSYWDRLRLLPAVSVTTDYADSCIVYRNNILLFGGKRVCVVNDDRWKNKSMETPLSVDYIYLCKGYSGHIEGLTSLFTVQHIILDASVSDYWRTVFLDECKRLGIPFTSLSEQSLIIKV